MSGSVNENPGRDLRAARVAETEERILRAARELFVSGGYAATTLAAVAEAAGVAARTVYVRFGTKAALLRRVIDVALVGDTLPIDVQSRSWVQASLTAPTAAVRIAIGAREARSMLERAGPVIAVAQQAAALEPEIAAAAQAGREATRDQLRHFWATMGRDGLLAEGADVAWLGDTAALIGAAETYVLMTRTLGWDGDAYEEWLRVTWTRMAAAAHLPAPPSP
jgi:AcrR family transcriptional regulator